MTTSRKLTVAQLNAYLGGTALWSPQCHGEGQVTVLVKLLDAKLGWESPFFKVEPIAGTGTTWVRGDKLEMKND